LSYARCAPTTVPVPAPDCRSVLILYNAPRDTEIGTATMEFMRLIVDITLVGVAGFEPTAPRSQSECATKLRHTPGANGVSLRAAQAPPPTFNGNWTLMSQSLSGGPIHRTVLH
jgi:hypothetical protein